MSDGIALTDRPETPVSVIFETKRARVLRGDPAKAVKCWAGFSVSLTVSPPHD
jgi:hypothetical protein